MKVYSIGRDYECNIVIDDNTDVISRRHAILNVSTWGKMTIVDQSHNGTYVNGIRINSNVPVPVTRKDNISFAHVARLDWNRVPKVYNPLLYVGIACCALLFIFAIIWGIKALGNMGMSDGTQSGDTVVLTPEQQKKQQDSIMEEAVKQAKDAQEQQRIQDSINAVNAEKAAKAKADSIVRVKQDSINRSRIRVAKCAYCGKPIDRCPYKGKYHKGSDNPGKKEEKEKKDTTKRFR